MKRTKLMVALAVVILVGIIVGGYILLNSRGSEGGISPIMGIGELTISNAPALNQTATLTYTLKEGLSGVMPGEKIFVIIALEDGLVWIDNFIPENRLILENRYLVENVIQSGQVKVSGTIKAIKTGRYNVAAFTIYRFGSGPDIYSGYPLYNVENHPFYDLENHRLGAIPVGSAGDIFNITIGDNSAQIEEDYWYQSQFRENENIHYTAPRPAFGIELDFLDKPSLDKEIDLTCKVWSSMKKCQMQLFKSIYRVDSFLWMEV
jgi:hypothetical protein